MNKSKNTTSILRSNSSVARTVAAINIGIISRSHSEVSMRKLRSLTIVFALMCATLVSAQSPQNARLRGRVLDATGAVLVDADVKVFQGNATEALKASKTNNSGDFDIEVPVGEYAVEVSAPDFETHREVVRVAPNMRALSVSLSLAGVTTTVDAQDDPNAVAVGVDPDSSLTAQTISGNAVADLPEDEDQLAAYLQELAGARGVAGGQGSFVIDGFGGGRLPPRDQIQEIRINNSPFSAEFSGQGFGPDRDRHARRHRQLDRRHEFQFPRRIIECEKSIFGLEAALPGAQLQYSVFRSRDSESFDVEVQRTKQPDRQ
jgi:hypothetical protein